MEQPEVPWKFISFCGYFEKKKSFKKTSILTHKEALTCNLIVKSYKFLVKFEKLVHYPWLVQFSAVNSLLGIEISHIISKLKWNLK
jgi:hypothetical protein